MKTLTDQDIQLIHNLFDNKSIDDINNIKEFIHNNYGNNQPVDFVKWVDINDVEPNDYNPNKVAQIEMGLLYTSILHDGYTQPVVTIYDEEKKKYVIIDGFHRYFTCKSNPDILERNNGRLPIVVLKKDINQRMAATVRHNRARGSHSISGMSNIIFSMLKNGKKDSEICQELGLDMTELIKLKHLEGFSKLFNNLEYNKSWKTEKMILLEKQYAEKNS